MARTPPLREFTKASSPDRPARPKRQAAASLPDATTAQNPAPRFPPATAEATGDLRARRAARAARSAVSSEQIEVYIRAVNAFVQDFNFYADREGLGLKVNARRLVAQVRGGYYAPVIAFCDGSGTGGRIWDNQIETFSRVHRSLLSDPVTAHLIIGAMQSGKTGSTLLLMIHALAFYLMTGIPLSPLYLLPDFLGQEAQTGAEMERFLLFYGLLEFTFDRSACTALPACAGDEWDAMAYPPALCTTSPQLDAVFARTPNLRSYVENILHLAQPRDLILRRGKSLAALERQMARMATHDLVPMPVFDEVQHGSSGTAERACMTAHILARIDRESVNGRAPRYICASATPFVEINRPNMKVVWQKLPSNYCGIVYFRGEAYPGYETAEPLRVASFSDCADMLDLPMLRQIDLGHYDAAARGRLDITKFRAWATRCDYPAGIAPIARMSRGYADFVEESLGNIVRRIVRIDGGVATNGRPRGICIRLRNNNLAARRLLARLDFESAGIDVVRFFGKLDGRSLRETLAARARPDLPYLVVVTARARMADAFPADTEHFLDFVDQSSDYNALLQGFVGRAMGAGKTSTVILSDDNATIVRDYVETRGSLSIPATRHGINVGDTTAARETSVLRVTRGLHPRLDAFFDEVQKTIVDQGVRADKGVPALMERQLQRLYGWKVTQHVPLLKLVRDYALDALIAEQPSLVLDGYAGETRIAGIQDAIRHNRTDYAYIHHPRDPDFIKIGLRTSGAKGGRGWRVDVLRKGRTPTAMDTLLNKPRSRDHLEPSLGLTPIGDGGYTLDYIDLPLTRTARVAGQGAMITVAKEHYFDARRAPCEALAMEFLPAAAAGRRTRTRATGIGL